MIDITQQPELISTLKIGDRVIAEGQLYEVGTMTLYPSHEVGVYFFDPSVSAMSGVYLRLDDNGHAVAEPVVWINAIREKRYSHDESLINR